MAEAFPLEWPNGWPRTPAHNRLAKEFHSDKSGGSDAKMSAINVAYEDAKRALS